MVSMIFNLLVLVAIGMAFRQAIPRWARLWLVVLAASWAASALLAGGYWAIFPRGTGFFTANRASALAAFLAAFVAPPLLLGLERRNH